MLDEWYFVSTYSEWPLQFVCEHRRCNCPRGALMWVPVWKQIWFQLSEDEIALPALIKRFCLWTKMLTAKWADVIARSIHIDTNGRAGKRYALEQWLNMLTTIFAAWWSLRNSESKFNQGGEVWFFSSLLPGNFLRKSDDGFLYQTAQGTFVSPLTWTIWSRSLNHFPTVPRSVCCNVYLWIPISIFKKRIIIASHFTV